MRRIGLVVAIVVCVWSAFVGATQAPDAGALSGPLRAHVQSETFQIVTSIRGLPLGVREALQTLFGSGTLDIAEPGTEFQRTNVAATPKLPMRRLAAAWCSIDHCLVYYERGGAEQTWHVALFHWIPAATRLEAGGLAPADLMTVDDLRNLILMGATKAQFW